MDYTVLAQMPLFEGLDPREVEALLTDLGGRERAFSKGEQILRTGDVTDELGIVTSGSVNVVINHYGGRREIFGHLEPGQVFAETYSALPGRELLVDVVAVEDARIVFLSTERLLSADTLESPLHNELVRNLVRITSDRTLVLLHRMMAIAPHTIRERVTSYLSEQVVVHGSTSFDIPFTRQQLADFLAVDRSALSAELSRMRRDGLLRTERNHFEVLWPCSW